MKHKLKIGDRVKWGIRDIWIEDFQGELGTIIKMSDDDGIIVKWDGIYQKGHKIGSDCQMHYYNSDNLIPTIYCLDFQEKIKDRLGEK